MGAAQVFGVDGAEVLAEGGLQGARVDQLRDPVEQVVLLDHGLYFDIDSPLRLNYSKLWLSLIAASSPAVNADRRRYAQLVGNIGPDLVSYLLLLAFSARNFSLIKRLVPGV